MGGGIAGIDQIVDRNSHEIVTILSTVDSPMRHRPTKAVRSSGLLHYYWREVCGRLSWQTSPGEACSSEYPRLPLTAGTLIAGNGSPAEVHHWQTSSETATVPSKALADMQAQSTLR